MARALISLPANPRRGQIIEVKALIAHDMETGFRHTQLGVQIPRDIITDFVCMYNGEEVFAAQLHPAIAANPYLAFSILVADSGVITGKWTGDNGLSVTESVTIKVA
jgi:sulfur-oxidizing protein SoxZ